MKKLKYIPPQVDIAEFRVEHGFEGTILGLGRSHNSIYREHERFLYEDQYLTGETYGGYTDAGGEYSTGAW